MHRLLRAGYPVSISTDDSSVFGTTASRELSLAAVAGGLTTRQLVALAGRDARGRGVGVLATLGGGGDAREATRTRSARRARVRATKRARERRSVRGAEA